MPLPERSRHRLTPSRSLGGRSDAGPVRRSASQFVAIGRRGPRDSELSTFPQTTTRHNSIASMGLRDFLHNDRSGTRGALPGRRLDMVHHTRTLDRSRIALSCLLSWLGQALSAGLDRAPILPRTSAALARPRSAPAISQERLGELLTFVRRDYDRARPPPTFLWAEFEGLARRRLGPRVLPLRHKVSTSVNTAPPPAPAAPWSPKTS